MAQNKTYTELLALIQALAGVDSFGSSEATKILALANRRLYQAYSALKTWPRYMVAAQARPMNDGIISYTYDATAGVRSATVASRSGTTVTIKCTTGISFVTGMSVTIAGLSGTTSPNGTYALTSFSTTTNTNDTFTYELLSGTGEETYSGTATITPVSVEDIMDFHRVSSGNPFRSANVRDYNFYVEGDNAIVSSSSVDGLKGVYVGYKKQWPGPYLSTSIDIPLEFFHYVAHASYADFLRMDDQTDKAVAEEQVAVIYLQAEMDRIHNQKNNQALSRFISHGTSQAR